jgi:quercetin dioxygenase-like cupin family protein
MPILPLVAWADVAKLGVIEHHHFASDAVPEGKRTYIKEVRIPAGVTLESHEHPYEHFSVLVSGSVTVKAGDTESFHSRYACLTIAAGVRHSVFAHTDTIWLCIHADDCRSPAEIDQSILKG